jgi:hypothetical protein
MFTPPVTLVPAPLPIVLVDDDAGARRILVALAGVPADAPEQTTAAEALTADTVKTAAPAAAAKRDLGRRVMVRSGCYRPTGA